MCKNIFKSTTEGGENNPTFLMTRIAHHQDKQAFVTLFKIYAPKLKSWLIKGGVTPSVAEEIIQDTFLTLWQKASLFNPEKASVATWLYTIARNKKN